MKIVHLCLAGVYTEGLMYQENLLSKYHARLGYDVTLLCNQFEYNQGILRTSSDTEYVNEEGVHVIRMQERVNISNKIVFYQGISECLDIISPDVLFIHGSQFWNIREVTRYLRAHVNITTYVDNHADLFNSATNWLSKNILHKIVWRFFVNKIAPYVRVFYGVLPARVSFLTDVYRLPEEKCELLVMGADDELVEKAKTNGAKERIRQQYRIGESDFLIMTGGKIDQWKTQTLLLMQAVRNIENYSVRLIVFGSVTQELMDQVEKLADGKKVQYIGWVQSKDTYDFFEAADLVVFPGRHSVMWEQVTGQGKPMLVKDWPGTHHVDLGGNVRFLRKDSEEEIREEIARLLNNPAEYMEMKTIAEKKGMQIFSYKKIAERAIKTSGE